MVFGLTATSSMPDVQVAGEWGVDNDWALQFHRDAQVLIGQRTGDVEPVSLHRLVTERKYDEALRRLMLNGLSPCSGIATDTGQ